MNCEMQLCQQGKARCPTPLTCSGAADDCESAIAALRATHQLHRVDDFTPGSFYPRDAAEEPMPRAEAAIGWCAIPTWLLVAMVAAICVIVISLPGMLP